MERLPELDAQRTDGGEPAHPGPGREAGLVPREALVRAVGVAGVDEKHALQTDALHDREDDLVVDDPLLAAADRRGRDDAPEDVLARLARPEGARLEAADRADAAREVALEERQLVAVDAALAEEPVAQRAAAVEVVEAELRTEGARPHRERRVAEVRLGEGEDDVAPDRADVAGELEPLAAAEEVVLDDARVEEELVGRAEAGARAEGAGLRLLHVHHHLHAVVLAGAPGGDVDALEEAEALQRLAALAQLAGREELLLLEAHLAADHLVARLGVAGHLDAVHHHRLAALDLVGDVDPLLLRAHLGLGLDAGEGVAVLGEPLGQLLRILAQRARLEDLAGRDREPLEEGLRVRGRVLARHPHRADPVLVALVDLDRDVEAIVAPLDARLVDTHRDVAVVVVPGRQPLHVGAQHFLVEHARAGDEAEEPLLPRLHDAAELAGRERLVAFEADLDDLDRLVLLDLVEDVDLVLAHRLGRVGERGVEVALLDVELLPGLEALARLLGVEDGVGADLERALELLTLHLLVALDLDRAHEGTLLHPEDDLDPVLGEARHVRVHLVEEAHRVDGADVPVDGVLVEGLARLRAQVDPDGVLLDAQVAGDADARDRGLALRAERHLPGDERYGRQQGDPPPPCVPRHDRPPHDVMPWARPRDPEPNSWRAPPARRSVRPIAAARRSLWVATTSAAPCSWLSSSMSCWTSSPVAGSRLPVGSSASRSRGRWARARTTATRCCSPPESCPGRCASRSRSPTRSSSSVARARVAANGWRAIRLGSMTFSSAVKSPSRWWNWKTKPISRLRKTASSPSERANTSTPSKRTRPPVGWSSAPRRWRGVDLPTPESPTMAIRSPASTSRSSAASTCPTAAPST